MDVIFQTGEFKLASGHQSDFKIECDYLTYSDIYTLVRQVRKKVRYKEAVGVLTGGLRLAQSFNLLNKQETQPDHLPIYDWLFVDDVYTTGGSIERIASDVMGYNVGEAYNRYFMGVVLFARAKPRHHWVKPIFQMWS